VVVVVAVWLGAGVVIVCCRLRLGRTATGSTASSGGVSVVLMCESVTSVRGPRWSDDVVLGLFAGGM